MNGHPHLPLPLRLAHHVVMSRSAQPSDTSKAAESLRKVAALTSNLPDDSPSDAKLRDRLELAAEVLDAAAEAQE